MYSKTLIDLIIAFRSVCCRMTKSKDDIVVYRARRLSWPILFSRLKKIPSKEAEELTKAILCDTDDPAEGCCTSWTCGQDFCFGDVMCIAVGFMLMLVIAAQAYKIVMDARRPSRQRC
ncbi:uncharacterized protein LOC114351822 [Ostrinia furnacalis]|uniref:uncharacterized protein LOC114351822 n=1 Tax=Ostrinia furnacalis TaxID=93504 RepID=UPI00103F7DB5|nr:uncharacterized protein LOC114351822 [Ostrinia furnacalis]